MICKQCGKENNDEAVFCTSCGSHLVVKKNCPVCGMELSEDSVYCNHCGAKVDGKNACPSCGKVVQDDAVYCNFCGARLDGKNVCPSCGELFDGNFCPKCGTAVSKKTENTDNNNEKDDSNKKALRKEKINNLFGKTGYSILLFGVVFALIFVFLIGFSVSIKSNIGTGDLSSVLDQYNISTKVSMYYYFGDAYDEIDAIKESMALDQQYIDYTSPAMYVSAVLGTVVVAVTILAVTILAILAIIQIIRKLRGLEAKNAEKLAFASMLSYILGTVLLYAFNSIHLKLSSGTPRQYIDAKLSYTPETLAGIILCAIAMGLAMIFFVFKNREEYKGAKNLVPSILGLASAVFAVIVVSFASSELYKLATTESSMSISLTSPVGGILGMWASYLQTNMEEDPRTYIELIVLLIIQVAFITLAITSIIKQVSSLARNEKSSGWGLNVALLVVATVYLALSIVTKNETNAVLLGESTDPYGEAVKTSFTVAPSIVAFVFAVLTLVTSVLKKTLPSVIPNNEIAENTETVA